jgi:hypothetical protein
MGLFLFLDKVFVFLHPIAFRFVLYITNIYNKGERK